MAIYCIYCQTAVTFIQHQLSQIAIANKMTLSTKAALNWKLQWNWIEEERRSSAVLLRRRNLSITINLGAFDDNQQQEKKTCTRRNVVEK